MNHANRANWPGAVQPCVPVVRGQTGRRLRRAV